MNRAIVFARRNIKELVRSPIGWIFGLLMPVGIFVIMQVIVKSIGAAASAVPMFGVDRFTGGAVVFGAAFLSLFAAMLISGDRKQSFLARLSASPMTATDAISGYMLGVMPLAAAGSIIIYLTALCFGLTPTAHILVAVLLSAVVFIMFAAIGVIFGSCMTDKNAPPVCSVVVQIAALLSGMWFDLETIGGGFDVFCHVLPFAHAYDMIRYVLAGDYSNAWLPMLVVIIYTVAFVVAAVFVFGRKAKRQ